MGGEESPEQQYSLRWNDFHASILSSFRHLRDEEDFVDVTLACDGCSFTAHKVVLSACSPYFRKLLKANPCQHPIVILRDVQQKDMESLLRFMYNGEVHIGQEQLGDFLKTAQMLQVRGLADVPAAAAHRQPINISATPSGVEHKLSPISSSLQWTPSEDADRETGTSPPPAKRSRSADQGRNYSPERPRSPRVAREGNELRDSLLGQALEGGPTIHVNSTNQKGHSDSSLQAQSTGEESNSSDTALSDRGGPVTPKTEPSDYPIMEDHPLLNNGGGAANLMDQARQHNFPGALLGLQGLPGLLPGPSGMHNSSPDNFGVKEEQSEEDNDISAHYLYRNYLQQDIPFASGLQNIWRCQECGKTYSSNNNLKQHMINIHSPIVTNYPCDVCGRGFKSRQYLATHKVRCHNIRRTECVRHRSNRRPVNRNDPA